MKRLQKSKRIAIKLLLIFALALCLAPAPNTRTATAATVSEGECVVEVASRRILHGRNESKQLPMASTTKILTALVIIEDCDLDETFAIPKQAEGIEGSSVYLRAGDEYSVRDLLYGLMLRSGNDCAVALALHHSGSIQKFANVMNRKALSIGADQSHFSNPHGLSDDTHYTTARDLALISAYAIQNQTFREIVSTKHYAPRNWSNKNKMLFEYNGAIGVKTGYTLRAGRCLVSGAERDGMTVVSVVLNSPQMFERSKELLDNAFQNYRLIPLCSVDQVYGGCKCKADFCYPLTKEEENKIRIETELLSELPAQSGEFAGLLKIYLENHLLFSQNLYMI